MVIDTSVEQLVVEYARVEGVLLMSDGAREGISCMSRNEVCRPIDFVCWCGCVDQGGTEAVSVAIGKGDGTVLQIDDRTHVGEELEADEDVLLSEGDGNNALDGKRCTKCMQSRGARVHSWDHVESGGVVTRACCGQADGAARFLDEANAGGEVYTHGETS